MRQQLAERVRLPAENGSPTVVRRMLRAMLQDAGVDHLIEDALLLASELCENAVLHAGTAFEFSVDLSDTELTVTVFDQGSTPLEIHRSLPVGPDDRAATHRRGLILVDRLATAWGTRHDASGHRTWFTLDLGRQTKQPVETARPVGGASGPVVGAGPAWPDPAVSRWLLHLGGDRQPQPDLELGPLVSELLRRLCDVLDADGAAVWVDYGDGEQELARTGRTPDSGAISIPLPLPAQLTGRLGLRAADADPRAVEIAALTAHRVGLAVGIDWVRATDRRRWSWLTYRAEASELLAHSLDVELTAALLPQLIVPRIGVWCAVHLLGARDQLELTALSHVDEAALPALRAGLDIARAELFALLVSGSDAVRIAAPSVGVAVPLIARGQPIGTLAVGRPRGRTHNPEEITMISDLARQAAPAIDNAQRHAAHVATSQALQHALLPGVLPQAETVEFAAVYLPASSGVDVGGDFYDVVELAEDSWMVAIGDVCGKGAAAAARTGLVRDVLRVLVRDGRAPAQALGLLNEMMLEAGDPNQFATVVLAVVNARPGGRPGLAVELVLAGHEQPVLVRVDGTVELVGRHGTAAGLVSEFSVHPTRHQLNPGDALVSYTDGVTENRLGDEEFGQARLLDALASLGGNSAAAIVSAVRQAVEGFSSDAQRDDIAVIAVRAPTMP